jgi:cephalosporin hydroxylase
MGLFRNIKHATYLNVVKAHNLFVPDPRPAETGAELREIDEIRAHAVTRTDISDHLIALFVESLAVQPRLIVELGVRSGESTFALERVARLCDSTFVSVDVEEPAFSSPPAWRKWTFVKGDDLEFARSLPAWCASRGVRPEVDVLLIDTNHVYSHTVKEIAHWFPLLAPKAKVFFHDTNMRVFYHRQDSSLGVGWQRNRGVMAAIEEYFGTKFNESASFTDIRKGWIVRHNALCSGFTVLERLNLGDGSNGNGAGPHES